MSELLATLHSAMIAGTDDSQHDYAEACPRAEFRCETLNRSETRRSSPDHVFK